MSGIRPHAAAQNLAGVGRVGLEARQLYITDHLKREADAPRGDADDVERRVLHQVAMVNALVATILARPLDPLEDALTFAAVDHLARSCPAPTLADVARLLTDPPTNIAARVNRPVSKLARDGETIVYALDKLLTRSLRGMFDGASTLRIDWDGPGVVLDLSAVHHDPDALPLVMVAATAWLQALMASGTRRQRVQVLDEAWCLLGTRHTASYLQACWKLGRTYGVANVAIAHRPSDLAAQADDGTATAKISGNQGLLKTGNVKGVRFDTLARLCEGLSCQPGDLLEAVEGAPDPDPDYLSE